MLFWPPVVPATPLAKVIAVPVPKLIAVPLLFVTVGGVTGLVDAFAPLERQGLGAGISRRRVAIVILGRDRDVLRRARRLRTRPL